jgi:outer membrane protein OmpA-like peptidoglycan-associated protein
MSIQMRSCLAVGVLLSPLLLMGCVSQGDYDALLQENRQLSAELAAARSQAGRLQGAIEYSLNSDLLFRPGSWEMNDRGKSIITDMAAKLAPTQRSKLMVSGYTDNAPIGQALRRQGVTTNQQLSEKRATSVMEFLISQGVRQDMVAAQGFGEANPIASNDTASGRAQNRRVVLSVPNSG